jgi:hypothetical protein
MTLFGGTVLVDLLLLLTLLTISSKNRVGVPPILSTAGRPASGRGAEKPEITIALTVTSRRFYAGGAFALRPVRVSDGKREREPEFHCRAGRPSDRTDLLASLSRV